MFSKLTSLFILVIASLLSFGQPGVAINTNGAAPSAAAILDISSTGKGVLLPRMSSNQRKAIANPEPGLLVYDLDKSSFYMYEGAQWRPIGFTTEKLLPLIERTPTTDDGSVQLGCDVGIFGLYAVAGAREEANGLLHSQGAVYVYHKDNNTWKLLQKLQPADGGNYDNFGKSVAIYNDIIVVGASSSKVNGLSAGALYIYKRTGTTWNLVKKLLPPIPEENGGFGDDVSVYNGKILVGCPRKTINGLTNSGIAYLYDNINNDWLLTKEFVQATPRLYGSFGESVKIYNNDVVIGYPGNLVDNLKTGSVQVFTRNPVNNTWQETSLAPSSFYSKAGMSFGAAVDIYKDSLIVGAPQYAYSVNNVSYPNAGVRLIYKRIGNVWQGPSISEGTKTNLYSGTAVAIGHKYYLESSPGESGGGMVDAGYYGYHQKYYEIERSGGAEFGKSVAISGNDFIIGAPGKNNGTGSVQFGTFE